MIRPIFPILPLLLLVLAPVGPAFCSPAAPANNNPARSAATNQTMPQAMQLFQAGRFTESRKVCDELILRGGKNRDVQEALYLKGKCCQALKQYTEAVACWEDLLKKGFANPRQEDAMLELAKTYAFDLNQPEPALNLYDRFFKKFPASKRLMEARYQECGLYYQQDKPEQAKAKFQRFLKEYPDSYLNVEVRKMIDLCDTKLAAVKKAAEPKQKPAEMTHSSGSLIEDSVAKLNQTVAGAEELFKDKQYEGALKAYQDIRRSFSASAKDELALFRIGQCFANMGQDDKAVTAWKEIITKSRGKPGSEYADDSLLALGDLYLQSIGEPEKALECYQTLIGTVPESELIPQAEHQLGLVYFYQGKMNEAQTIFEKEREITPQDTNAPPDSLTRLIEACNGDRRYAPEYTETVQGQRANTQLRRGDVYFTAKDYEKAKQAYGKAERLAPGSEEAAYALMQAGRCYNQLGQPQRALGCYKQFLDKYKSSQWADDALIRAGVIYVGPLNDRKSGIKMYETILDKYPNSNEADQAQIHIASLAYWAEDWKKALELHEKFLMNYPDSRFAFYVKKERIPTIMKALGMQATEPDIESEQ
jgi:tetratricopeptide (TPR) repeat protein